MLVPVLNLNPGIRKHQHFYASFFNLIQDEPKDIEVELNFEDDETDEDICVDLNDVYTEAHIQRLLKAEE